MSVASPLAPGIRAPLLVGVALALAVTASPRASTAAPVDIANEVRSQGCQGRPAAEPLRSVPKLDDAARRVIRGASPDQAMSKVGYRASQSAMFSVSSDQGDEAVARALRTEFCELVTDATYAEVGVARRGRQTLLLLAAPVTPPQETETETVRAKVLALVNAARAQPRQCGDRSFPAAPPLQLVPALHQAAMVHATYMAERSTLSHEGRAGSTPAQRVEATGYKWRVVGENVAGGPMTADIVVNGWLASPHHCENIMDPRFTQMGVAWSFDPKSNLGIYWAQVFATPR